MTAQETIDAFKHYIDQFTTARAPNIDFWINEAIEGFIVDRSSHLFAQPYGFQSNQRIRDDLSEVIRFNVTASYLNGIVDYPEDCYQVIPNSIGCQTSQQANKEVKYVYARARTWDWYYSHINDPFVKPLYKEGRLSYIESDDGIYIFPAGDYDDVVMSYIKNWEKFDLELDQPIPLRLKTHISITRLAAAKYLISIGNEKGAKELMAQNMQE